jgi:general secretion pathway protein G
MLAAIVVVTFVEPGWFAGVRDPRVTARSDMNAIGAALETYRHDTGRYPTTEEGLEALHVAPADSAQWLGPYLVTSVPNDPWGQPYVYRREAGGAEGFSLVSYGADRRAGGTGTDADVVFPR